VLAIIAGLISLFRPASPAYRILLLKITISFCVELAGAIMRIHKQQNIMIYNYYMFVDFGLLLLVAYTLQPNKTIQRTTIVGSLAFLVFWFYELYQKAVFFQKAYATESLVLIILFLVVLYHSIIGQHTKSRLLPTFWLCLSVLVFYGGTIAFLSMLNYCIDNLSNKELDLLSKIPIVLSNICYLCTTVCFLVLIRSKKGFG
jgi:hypothetical protein